VRILRGVVGKLVAALVVLVFIALAINYLIVVPRLKQELVNNRLNRLQSSAETIAVTALRGNPDFLQLRAEDTASTLDARVVVFQILGPPLKLLVLADSLRTGTAAIENDPVALLAARAGRIERGTVSRAGGKRAEVAVPVPLTDDIVLVSGTLNEATKSVETVREQLLVAAVPALLIALAIGLIGARGLTARIRRLERAADRIAAGSFDEPVVDVSRDEVGQLARSFECMRQRLAQLDSARKEFIANASHELRTPIFALSGSLELLSEEEMDEASRREFLETMRSQVERLQKLAAVLLDLSRLDAGKSEMTIQPLALAPLAEALRNEFEAAAELSGHRLRSAIESDAVVGGDEQRVLQIGRVLVENALVHTSKGVSVSIGTAESDGYGQLIVEDDGRGIPAEEQERVFERFARLEGEQSSGSGLGLAIAREWARRMHGDLTLESKPGATRFTLSLPAPENGGSQDRQFSRENGQMYLETPCSNRSSLHDRPPAGE
jgi:signal transduction histidine kinase